MLKLVTPETPRESILGPDDLTSDFEASCLQCVLEFTLPGGTMANVQRTAGLHHTSTRAKRGAQELFEFDTDIRSPRIFRRSPM
jgi:hypothetical protein